jgi:hypothetical protein
LQIDPRENAGRTEPTFGEQVGISLYGLAESLGPYLSQIRRMREGGGTAYAGSTILDPDVKPGTSRMSAARRTFDPLRPTYLTGGASSGPAPAAPVEDDPIRRALKRRAAGGRSTAVSPAIQRALQRRAQKTP